MNRQEYFESLTSEFGLNQNRMRNIIEDRHWPSDGEWKESLIRSVLKRHLPDSVRVGRGFVLTPEKLSNQIDILIYDASKPVISRDGDLVVITPDATKAVIEVKTSIRTSDFKDIINKLCETARIIKHHSGGKKFFGLFSYEDKTNNVNRILKELEEAVKGSPSRMVHCIVLGKSKFIRYWDIDPIKSNHIADRWHAYNLTDLAPAYFIHNVIESICPYSIGENRQLWYPNTEIEVHKVAEIEFKMRR